jgi:hypothetical protein
MWKLFVVWVLSLTLVGALAAAVTAQVARPAQPRILSGNDIGFRLDGTDRLTGRPTGRIVVRLNGQWVEPVAPIRAHPAADR